MTQMHVLYITTIFTSTNPKKISKNSLKPYSSSKKVEFHHKLLLYVDKENAVKDDMPSDIREVA